MGQVHEVLFSQQKICSAINGWLCEGCVLKTWLYRQCALQTTKVGWIEQELQQSSV